MAGFVKQRGTFDGGDTLKSADTAATNVPSGTTAQRPSVNLTGDIRFNSSTSKMEYFDGSAYQSFSKESDVAITQDSFTGDGSTVAFTMSKAVTSNQEQRVLVAVGNVYQNPASAYNVVGTTIRFTSAPGGSEPIVVIHGFDSTSH